LAHVPALGVLALAAVFYTGVNFYRLDHFYGLDFDLAIFGQGLWLLSHGHTPLVTVRGLHLFGEHATYVHLFMVPLYGLLGPVAGVRVLVLIQSLALALAGGLLYRMANRMLGPRVAFLLLSAYLVFPPLQFTWLEYYEPVALAVPCLVGAYWAIDEGRDRAALVWSAFALVSMENLALTVAALGFLAIRRGRPRVGGALIVGSALYVSLVMIVVFPWLHRGGYVYGDRFYGDFARSLPGALAYLARPDQLWSRLGTFANARYLLDLLVPVGFLPLAAPATLALASQLPLNMVSSWPYAHEIRYHYVAPVIPFVFLATIRGLARFGPGSHGRRWSLAALLLGVVAGEIREAPPWLRPGSAVWRSMDEDEAERRAIGGLLARIPPQAVLSVQSRFLPHLVDRPSLYMFPDTGPDWPDALLIDADQVAEVRDYAVALRRCQEEGGFREVLRARGTGLFLRTAAPGVAPLRLEPSRELRPAPPAGLIAAPDRR